ncbi:Uncharacterised protein [Ewingella americana]|uniref:Uncharacterized protein n=1 Tax=Ewingella americana TaxID=41202 RepID=A0A377NG70_9GAMM|nr:Uncharacterised protein [Ewingella americana]
MILPLGAVSPQTPSFGFSFQSYIQIQDLALPRKLAQKARKRAPSGHPRFLSRVDRGCAGSEWTCFSDQDDRREVPPLRRFPPVRASSHRSRTTPSASHLNATYWLLNRAVPVERWSTPLKRHGVNASRPRSEMTPSKRWKTACLFTRVGIPQRGHRLSGVISWRSQKQLKHVHLNPAKPRSNSSKKTQDSKGFRLKPFGPVWAASPRF